MSVQTIGQAFIAINPDTTKTGAAVTTAMGTVGKQAGASLSTGLATGVGAGVAGVGSQMSKFTGIIRQSTGTALGPVMELQQGFEGIGETIKQNGALSAQGFAAMGTGVAGAGLALMTLGSSEKQATAQLSAAITASGQDISDYKVQIDDAVKSDEKFGISAGNTERALQSLTTITGDAGQATDLIGLAANLAAARHISLSAAATQVGKAAEGNTRLFKMYGITIGTNADGTKDLDGAMDELSKRLDGQAAASVSGFTGHLKVLGTEVEDQVSSFGQKYGPAITAAGSAMVLLTAGASGAVKLVDMLRSSTEASTAATEADIAVTEASTAAVSADATVAGTASAAETALATAEANAAASAVAAGAEMQQLALFNEEVAASADTAAEATVAEGVATRGSMLGMAAGAGVAGIALVGVGLLVNHFMSESKKQADEGKAAFDAFWASTTANRNQSSLVDLTAESKDLQTQLDGVSNGTIRVKGGLDGWLKETSLLKNQIKDNNSTIATMTSNISSLGDEFQLTGAQVEDLAQKNNIDLTGSLSGLETKFQAVLGGTEAVILQTASLSKEYGVAGSVIADFATTQGIVLDGNDKTTQSFEKAATAADMYTVAQTAQQTALSSEYAVGQQSIEDFAKAQKITLDGTTASTTAFQAAVTVQQQTGSKTQILASDYDNLYSSLSSVTDKQSAFNNTLDTLIGTNLSAEQAIDDFQQKVNDLGKALSTNSHTLDGMSDSAITNRKSIEDLVTAATNATDQTYKQTGSVDEANATYDIYYSKIVAAAKANGINQSSLADLLSSLGALPPQVTAALGASAGVGTNAGTAVTSAMSAAINSKASIEQVTAAASELPNALNKSLPDEMGSVGMTAADSLVGGYIAGLTQGFSDINRISSQVPAAARAGLQMHSPSIPMVAIGTEAAASLALGLAGGAAGVAAAATKLGLAAVPAKIGGGIAAAVSASGLHIQPAQSHANVMPKGGGVQVNGKWYTEDQLAAMSTDGTPAGGIAAAIAANPATGGALGAANGQPVPVTVANPSLSASDLTPIVTALQELLKGIDAEVAATNNVTKAIQASDSGLGSLVTEIRAGKK